MKTSALSFLFLISTLALKAQCNSFFPMKENVKYQYDHFDKKEKLSLRTRQWFKDVKGSGNTMNATMVQEMIDVKKDELIGTSESDWKCDDGTLHFEINNMSFAGQAQPNMGGSGMTMDVTGDQMDIPNDFEVGETLKDLTYQIKMAVNGMTMMNKSFHVKNRKVEAKESVTTRSGNYDCFKVSFTTTSEGGIGSGTIKTLIWYAKGVGMVKSENYDKNNKLMSRQVLTKVSGS
ncbi:MAG TPA: hypothetical protein VD884_16530 [Ohtaekwangia sp.]|nr:hypothetical protein [Ohtaekwangia sp.]